MIRIKVSDGFPEWRLLRQTPGGSGRWGDCRFFHHEEVAECDYWVVHDRLKRAETTRCPPENVFFISYEPPALKPYNRDFLAQFGRVFGPDSRFDHPRATVTQPSVPWFVGQFRREAPATKDYDELKAASPPVKTRLLSTITSHLDWSPGHRRRYEFVTWLKQRLGDRLDLYGRGIRDLDDKWDGIAPYRYHLAIENSAEPHYWTEKLADGLLGWAHPIYCGCTNVADYLPADAITAIDLDDFEAAAATIEATIASDRYERSLGAIAEARRLILDRYNVFPTLAALCTTPAPAGAARSVTLHPEESFLTVDELAYNLRVEREYLRSVIAVQDRVIRGAHATFETHYHALLAAQQAAERYARSLEAEIGNQRQEYARLEGAYRRHEEEAGQYTASLREALQAANARCGELAARLAAAEDARRAAAEDARLAAAEPAEQTANPQAADPALAAAELRS